MPIPRCLLARNPEVPKQDKHREIGSDMEATVRHMLWLQNQHGHQQIMEGESPQQRKEHQPTQNPKGSKDEGETALFPQEAEEIILNRSALQEMLQKVLQAEEKGCQIKHTRAAERKEEYQKQHMVKYFSKQKKINLSVFLIDIDTYVCV